MSDRSMSRKRGRDASSPASMHRQSNPADGCPDGDGADADIASSPSKRARTQDTFEFPGHAGLEAPRVRRELLSGQLELQGPVDMQLDTGMGIVNGHPPVAEYNDTVMEDTDSDYSSPVQQRFPAAAAAPAPPARMDGVMHTPTTSAPRTPAHSAAPPRVPLPDFSAFDTPVLTPKRTGLLQQERGTPKSPGSPARHTHRTPKRINLDGHVELPLKDGYYARTFGELVSAGDSTVAHIFKVRNRSSEHVCVVKRDKAEGAAVSLRQEVGAVMHLLTTTTPVPNVCHFIDAWQEGGLVHIQMVFYEGGNLANHLLTAQPLSDAQIWGFVADLATGLKSLHSNDLIHMDLKPENIFLDGQRRLYIGDLGCARKRGRAVSPREQEEGDSRYISFEVWENPGPYCDIFSLGLIIYEAAYNVNLPGRDQAWRDLRTNPLQVPAASLQARPDELLQLIRQMTDVEWGRRPTAETILNHPRVLEALYRGSS